MSTNSHSFTAEEESKVGTVVHRSTYTIKAAAACMLISTLQWREKMKLIDSGSMSNLTQRAGIQL
jgi:hypothetical protein